MGEEDYKIRDYIRGSLMGGAAGDALGYTVEFMERDRILARYGEQGITEFELDRKGKALVSDDTQMTLFTANAMLMGLTRGFMRGIGGNPCDYVDKGCIDWYYTQTGCENDSKIGFTWLKYLPEMAYQRAPGNTCLSACRSMLLHKEVENNSKGCGGIMRVAPMGLLSASYQSKKALHYSVPEVAEAGAKTAMATHLHPLGFLPAAMMTELIYKLVPLTPDEAKTQICELAEGTIATLDEIYKDQYLEDRKYLADLTRKAIRLAQSDVDDSVAIPQLGEGWVAEETWAIALYCSIKHVDSIRDAIISAVNHDGDSDSTGSVAGNIMGAIWGYDEIKRQRLFCPEDREFEDTIELANIILAIADDISTGCIISEYDFEETPEKLQWFERYCMMKPAGIKR